MFRRYFKLLTNFEPLGKTAAYDNNGTTKIDPNAKLLKAVKSRKKVLPPSDGGGLLGAFDPFAMDNVFSSTFTAVAGTNTNTNTITITITFTNTITNTITITIIVTITFTITNTNTITITNTNYYYRYWFSRCWYHY